MITGAAQVDKEGFLITGGNNMIMGDYLSSLRDATEVGHGVTKVYHVYQHLNTHNFQLEQLFMRKL